MNAAITLWLAFVTAAGVIAWFGNRRQAIAFALVAAVVAPAAFITLGYAAPWQPTAGQYKVLGARIDVDKAIYVLLDADPEPRFYKFPYSKEAAGELQNAQDSADAHGSSVMMRLGGSAPGFAEEGQPDHEPQKQTEPQAIIN